MRLKATISWHDAVGLCNVLELPVMLLVPVMVECKSAHLITRVLLLPLPLLAARCMGGAETPVT